MVFSINSGKVTGAVDGFSTPDWDYISEIATKKAIMMRSEGFIHPSTLVPSGLGYADGYKAVMDILHSKMKPIQDQPQNNQRKESYEDPD